MILTLRALSFSAEGVGSTFASGIVDDPDLISNGCRWPAYARRGNRSLTAGSIQGVAGITAYVQNKTFQGSLRLP
jgi:hypothetical protein